MSYKNLVEDEEEALKERQGVRLATVLILIGSLLLLINWNKMN